MTLDVFTALILTHPTDENQILLLRRSPEKKLFPNLITGIGGKVELEQGEGRDLDQAMWREFTEETKIPPSTIENARLRLTTIVGRGEKIVLLLWYTGKITLLPQDLSCNEGTLAFFDKRALPLGDMVPTASRTIPFICALAKDDPTVYVSSFANNKLTVSKHDFES